MTLLKNTKELLDLAKKYSDKIVGEKSEALHIDCMNNIGIYSCTINVNNKFAKWVRSLEKNKFKFDPKEIYKIKVMEFKPIARTIYEAITLSDGQYILDFNKLLNKETFRIEVSYNLDEDWLSSIVKARSSPEPLQDAQKWNLSAQLKDPSSLVSGFSEVEVDEYPVNTEVYIQELINNNIPNYMKQLTEIEHEILSDYNPRSGIKILSLQKKRHKLKKKLGDEDLLSKLKDISIFLKPEKFRQYIKTELFKDFRLHDCCWGEDIFRALGMMPLPSKMNVISRTDLTLKKPGSSGVLLYESKKFEEDFLTMFQ